jgi:hypothetical protein
MHSWISWIIILFRKISVSHLLRIQSYPKIGYQKNIQSNTSQNIQDTIFFPPASLSFNICVLSHLLCCRSACSIAFHSPELSQVKRRAVYGVVIVSYIAPYLPETLQIVNITLLMQVLCHSSRAGYVTYTITAHHVRCTSTASCFCVSCTGSAS